MAHDEDKIVFRSVDDFISHYLKTSPKWCVKITPVGSGRKIVGDVVSINERVAVYGRWYEIKTAVGTVDGHMDFKVTLVPKIVGETFVTGHLECEDKEFNGGHFRFDSFEKDQMKGWLDVESSGRWWVEFSSSSFPENDERLINKSRIIARNARDRWLHEIFTKYSDIAPRFRAANRWAKDNGFVTAIPNGEEKRHQDGVHFGLIAFKEPHVKHFEVSAKELHKYADDLTDPAALLRAAHHWARDKDRPEFISGIPTFEKDDKGGVTYYGVTAIRKSFGSIKDINNDDLKRHQKEINDLEQQLRATHRWGSRGPEKRKTAIPTFQQSRKNGQLVRGVLLPRDESIEILDIGVLALNY